jgi:hypothetical protein
MVHFSSLTYSLGLLASLDPMPAVVQSGGPNGKLGNDLLTPSSGGRHIFVDVVLVPPLALDAI